MYIIYVHLYNKIMLLFFYISTLLFCVVVFIIKELLQKKLVSLSHTSLVGQVNSDNFSLLRYLICSVMCPSSTEWWLDHKGTKILKVLECSSTKSLHSVQSTLCEMQSMTPLGGSRGMPPRKISKKLLYEIEFRSNFDYN